MGDHEALAQLGQQGQVVDARDLKRPVNDVTALDRCTLDPVPDTDVLHVVERLEHLAGVAAEPRRHECPDARVPGPRDGGDQLKHMQLRARHRTLGEDASVDHDRQALERPASRAQRAREGSRDVLLGSVTVSR